LEIYFFSPFLWFFVNFIKKGCFFIFSYNNFTLPYYHQRKHGGTGQAPLVRVDKSQRQLLRKTMAELTEEDVRKVRTKYTSNFCRVPFGRLEMAALLRSPVKV